MPAGLVEVSGTASINLFNLLTGTVAFSVEIQSGIAVDVNRDGTIELPAGGVATAPGPRPERRDADHDRDQHPERATRLTI